MAKNITHYTKWLQRLDSDRNMRLKSYYKHTNYYLTFMHFFGTVVSDVNQSVGL